MLAVFKLHTRSARATRIINLEYLIRKIIRMSRYMYVCMQWVQMETQYSLLSPVGSLPSSVSRVR